MLYLHPPSPHSLLGYTAAFVTLQARLYALTLSSIAEVGLNTEWMQHKLGPYNFFTLEETLPPLYVVNWLLITRTGITCTVMSRRMVTWLFSHSHYIFLSCSFLMNHMSFPWSPSMWLGSSLVMLLGVKGTEIQLGLAYSLFSWSK